MHVLYVYCHPLADSFHAAIRSEALAGLAEAGHTIDLLDLYAEGFDPVLNAELRRDYHDPVLNRRNNEAYAARLAAANALVVQFPTWSFGPPAMLKGWFDRMFGPGIALDLSDPAHARPMLQHIGRIVGIATYGRPRWQAVAMADPPRKIIKRYLPWFTGGKGARELSRALSHECRHREHAQPLSRKAAARDGPVLAAPRVDASAFSDHHQRKIDCMREVALARTLRRAGQVVRRTVDCSRVIRKATHCTNQNAPRLCLTCAS